MNLRDLVYVEAVARLKHFSLAAEECHVSQPTLSSQIKKLEDYLNVPLFERTNKKVMLTDYGHQLLAPIKRILQEVERIEETALLAQDPLAGKFRLGAFPTLSTYIFPGLVPQIKQKLPNLRLILVEEKTAHLIEQVKQGQLDAAFLALPVSDPELLSLPLFEDVFYVAVPTGHALTKYKTIEPSQLLNYPLLLLEEGHCLRDQSLAFCQMAGIQEEQDVRATGLETLRQMVKAGTGITFMPNVAIHWQQPDEGIVYIPFKAPVPRRTIGLIWRKTSARKQVIEAVGAMLRSA